MDDDRPTTDLRPTDAARWTRAEVAARLGITVSALKRLQLRIDRPGIRSAGPAGGALVLLSDDDVEALAASVRSPTDRSSTAVDRASVGRQQKPGDERRPADDRPTLALRSVDDPAWLRKLVEGLTEQTGRAAAAEALLRAQAGETERLRELVDAKDLRVVELERRADVLETQLRRSRDESDRWRAQAEGLRTAWHTWRRALDGSSWWRLARRKLPAEPPEFTSGPAIAQSEG